jgi:hypothetical protein
VALWARNLPDGSKLRAPLGDSVHAGDGQGNEQREQDEDDECDDAEIGHLSLTFLRGAEQSESVWALGHSGVTHCRRPPASGSRPGGRVVREGSSAARTSASIITVYVDGCQYRYCRSSYIRPHPFGAAARLHGPRHRSDCPSAMCPSRMTSFDLHAGRQSNAGHARAVREFVRAGS